MHPPSNLLRAALVGAAAVTLFSAPAHAFKMLGKGVRLENLSVSATDLQTGVTQQRSDGVTTLLPRGIYTFVALVIKPACRVNGKESDFGMIFSRRGNFSGSIKCDPYRTGTATAWQEWIPSGTYTTTSILAGRQIALSGQLRHVIAYRTRVDTSEAAGTRLSDYDIRLKIALSPGQCRIIEYALIYRTRFDGRGDHGPVHTASTTQVVATPASTCRFLD